MMMKRKKILTVVAFLAFNFAANAEHALVVQLVNGSTQSYVLANKPEITMADGMMNVTSTDVSSAYKMTSVTDYHFVEVPASQIQQVNASELRFVRQSKDQISIYGNSGTVTVYDANGKQQSAVITVGGTEKDINLSSMPKGMYIIKTDSQSYKITK